MSVHPAIKPKETKPMASDNKKIVVIEDDPEMIELVKLILTKDGFQVFGAGNGREGLGLIEEELPSCVLLDLMMPDMDGWEVYQSMKADDNMKHIPVIIITAKSQSIDKVLGLHIAKVDDYITKPFTPTELTKSVNKVTSSN
jgi:two-component system, OmpR family, response regulator VicR